MGGLERHVQEPEDLGSDLEVRLEGPNGPVREENIRERNLSMEEGTSPRPWVRKRLDVLLEKRGKKVLCNWA